MSEFANFEPMFKETYTLILNGLRKNQIYILNENGLLSRVCWLKLVANFLAAVSHTGGVMERMEQGADLVQLSTDLSATLIVWQTVLLYTQICVNRKLIGNLIMNLGSRWPKDDQLQPEMVAVKHKSVNSFHKWISLFYKTLIIYVVLYLMSPLLYSIFKCVILKEDLVLVTPFHVKVPFRYDDNIFLYGLVYLADSKILLDVSYLVTSDLLLMNAAMHHLRLLFIMLQHDLRIVVKPDEDNQQTAEIKLKKIIPLHRDLQQLMSELSEAFGAIFLIHLAFFSGTMCFFGFAARVHCSPESIKNLLATSFILICIYTCCSFGQHLTHSSVDIAEAAYDGQWHLMSEEFKRCILFIMLKSQKAQYIRSTSFTDVSLQTFTKILNATWSFLSLITEVYEA